MAGTNNVIYRDLDIHFNVHPVSKKVRVLENIDAIKQALKNLIMMDNYEGLYQPNLKTNIKGSLFDNLDSGDITLLQQRVYDVVKLYEPRVSITGVDVKDELDNNGFRITIYFVPENALTPVTVDVFLKRVR